MKVRPRRGMPRAFWNVARFVLVGFVAVGCSAEPTLVSDTATAPAPTPIVTPAPPPTVAFAPTPVPTAPPLPTPVPEPTATADPEPTSTPGPFLEDLVASLEGVRTAANLEPGDTVYLDFVDITDAEGLISVTVPAEWTDIDGSSWGYQGNLIGPAVSASPDLDAFFDAWGTPGLFIAASDEITDIGVEGFLDESSFDDECVHEGRHPYDDGLYIGLFDAYIQCGPEESVLLQIVAAPPDGAYLVQAQFLIAFDADWLAVERAINTFTAQVAVA